MKSEVFWGGVMENKEMEGWRGMEDMREGLRA